MSLTTNIFLLLVSSASIYGQTQMFNSSSYIPNGMYELIYSSADLSSTGNGNTFTIKDPLLADQGKCNFDNPRSSASRPSEIPLNVEQSCTPSTFKFTILSRDGSCGPQMEISHAIQAAPRAVYIKKGTLQIPCARGRSSGQGQIIVSADFVPATNGTKGDPLPPRPQSNSTDSDTQVTNNQSARAVPEANFVPSPFLNSTIVNSTLFPGQTPTFYGCLCNCTYDSYACCDSPSGEVNESFMKKLGQLDTCPNPKSQQKPNSATPAPNATIGGDDTFDSVKPAASISVAATASDASGSPSHHTCAGYCYGAARSCSWASEGDCTCSAPHNEILFWKTSPCVATAQNPNKAHDKRSLSGSSTAFSSRYHYEHPLYRGPKIDPSREPGVCNESYVSYACKDSVDGIVHEPLSNWLGAMLPRGSKTYPPIPDEFLRVHSIQENPDLGEVELPFW